MILKRMFFLREQSMTKKSMTFQNAVSPHMGRGERVTRLHQQIAACGIETSRKSGHPRTKSVIALANCRVRH